LLPAYSAVLSLPDQVASPGQVVAISSAFLSGGQPISGLQFDLQWDQALDLKLVAGDQLRQSTKLLFTASIGPRTLRCLIVGMNQDVLPDGQLFRVFLAIDPGCTGLAQTHNQEHRGDRSERSPVPLKRPSQMFRYRAVRRCGGFLRRRAQRGQSHPGASFSPGEIITLFGNLPNTQALLLFNGIPAPVLYAGLNQVNAIVPFGLALDAPANLEVRTGSGSSIVSVPVAPVAPAIFTQDNAGLGQGAILNQDLTTNSPSNPAMRGSIVVLYGTGFGMLDSQPADGITADRAVKTQLSVTASIAGVPAEVTYAGSAPGSLPA
jgi:uncharacterized protein (TIGR03437 family)